MIHDHMAHFFMIKSGSKFRDQLAHFFIDIHTLQSVGEGNVIFWVKAMSTSDESPKNDTTVDVQAEGLIVEV